MDNRMFILEKVQKTSINGVFFFETEAGEKWCLY